MTPNASDAQGGGALPSAVNARVAAALLESGRASVTQIAERTGLSRPTVDAELGRLREAGLARVVEDAETGERRAGRPARFFEFSADAGLLVGVDVGIHRLRVVLAELDGRVIGWHETESALGIDGDERIALVISTVRAALRGAGVHPDRLLRHSCLALAVSGVVDPGGRILVSHNFPEWEGVDLAGLLSGEFGCAAVVENDIRLAALAEFRLGAARHVDDVAYVFAGHRVSLGLIIDGKIRRGKHSVAGEIGLGGFAFSSQVDSTGKLRWSSAESGEQVFRAAAAGDRAASEEIVRFAQGLAVGVAIVTMAVDPDLVIVGGGLSLAGEELLGPLRRAVNAEITLPVEPEIVPSQLGAESVALGALSLAAQRAAEIRHPSEPAAHPGIDLAQVRAVVARTSVGSRGDLA